MKRTIITLVFAGCILACGNAKKDKLGTLTKQRQEIQDKKKAYVDSVFSLGYSDTERDSFNRIYNDSKNPIRTTTGEVPVKLNNYWKKIDECNSSITAFDEEILKLSREIDKK